MAIPPISEDQMRELRIELAKRLGEDWTHNPNGERHWEQTRITRKDGARIYINSGQNAQRGKVNISGSSDEWTDMYRGDRDRHPMPDIYVAFDRGIDVIVREIQRRVLPELDAAQTAALAAKAEKLAFGRAHKQTVDRVKAAFGKHVWHTSGEDDILKGEAPQVKLSIGRGVRPRVDVKIQGPDSIDFEIDTDSPDVAVKIAEFLQTIFREVL